MRHSGIASALPDPGIRMVPIEAAVAYGTALPWRGVQPPQEARPAPQGTGREGATGVPKTG